MGFRPHGRARVDTSRPSAFGVCDRCGFLYNLRSLRWQFDYAGVSLINQRILVCQTCLDVPQQQKRPVILPADPLPVPNARVEPYYQDETNIRTTQDGAIRITQDDDTRVTQSNEWVSYLTTNCTGNGTTATVTFNGGLIPVGTQVTITGVVPAGYNGTFTVLSSSSGSISFANPTTESQTIGGTLIVPKLQGTG